MEQIMNGAVIISLPFEGCAQTFITKDGKIAYSTAGTFEEYQAQKSDLSLRVISWEEFNALHREYYTRQFTEITEDQYEEALCELPPLKWHNASENINVFFCAEAMSGDMHSCYIHDRAKKSYFCGMMSQFSTDAEILAQYQKI